MTLWNLHRPSDKSTKSSLFNFNFSVVFFLSYHAANYNYSSWFKQTMQIESFSLSVDHFICKCLHLNFTSQTHPAGRHLQTQWESETHHAFPPMMTQHKKNCIIHFLYIFFLYLLRGTFYVYVCVCVHRKTKIVDVKSFDLK